MKYFVYKKAVDELEFQEVLHETDRCTNTFYVRRLSTMGVPVIIVVDILSIVREIRVKLEANHAIVRVFFFTPCQIPIATTIITLIVIIYLLPCRTIFEIGKSDRSASHPSIEILRTYIPKLSGRVFNVCNDLKKRRLTQNRWKGG